MQAQLHCSARSNTVLRHLFFFTAPDPWLYLSIETTLPARLSGTKKSDKWWNIVQLHKAPHNYFCQSSYSTCEGDMFSPHFTCLWASTIFLSQVSCKVSTEALQTVWPEGVAVDLATSEKLFHGVIFANPPILVQLNNMGPHGNFNTTILLTGHMALQ